MHVLFWNSWINLTISFLGYFTFCFLTVDVLAIIYLMESNYSHTCCVCWTFCLPSMDHLLGYCKSKQALAYVRIASKTMSSIFLFIFTWNYSFYCLDFSTNTYFMSATFWYCFDQPSLSHPGPACWSRWRYVRRSTACHGIRINNHSIDLYYYCARERVWERVCVCMWENICEKCWRVLRDALCASVCALPVWFVTRSLLPYAQHGLSKREGKSCTCRSSYSARDWV